MDILKALFTKPKGQREIALTTEKDRRQEMLLITIYLLCEQDEKQRVARSLLIDCLRELSERFLLNYRFSVANPYYSQILMNDLDDLKFDKWYIKQHEATQNALSLPKTFIELRPLGRGHARSIIKELSSETIETLKSAIKIASERQR